MFTAQQFSDHVWNEIVQSLTVPDIRTLASAVVDDKTWHTVKLSMPAAEWIRTQNCSLWVELVATDNWASKGTFDIEESLFTVMLLKWK
jgi:hypothetical protein